ncbi:MAG: hypothetical protein K8T25_18120 [Planctomycetia bacterium]|nr:hypothetical protein [Planctomycetia bacterium]
MAKKKAKAKAGSVIGQVFSAGSVAGQVNAISPALAILKKSREKPAVYEVDENTANLRGRPPESYPPQTLQLLREARKKVIEFPPRGSSVADSIQGDAQTIWENCLGIEYHGQILIGWENDDGNSAEHWATFSGPPDIRSTIDYAFRAGMAYQRSLLRNAAKHGAKFGNKRNASKGGSGTRKLKDVSADTLNAELVALTTGNRTRAKAIEKLAKQHSVSVPTLNKRLRGR